ncbi:MAG TPA: glycosyltransferase, partial [Opitutaceae bacterium]|nr:glycosyltransferase [Opitutaceae bacterium]
VATENGISKKIRAQAIRWTEAGHAVCYFSLAPTTRVWPGLAPLETDLVARGNPLSRLSRSFVLTARVRAWQPDVIYFRYAYHSPGFPALFRRIPTVAEINSDDLAEYPITLSRAKLAYHRLTRRRVLSSVAGFVHVTHELAVRFQPFGKPAQVIGNGIDLDAFAPAPVTVSSAPLRLIFIGSSGTPWHGLERLAELACLLPEFHFDVVGCPAPPEPQPPNLQFHGALTRVAYEPLLQQATAAIGTMALFRKHMEEACPLKVREYLAAGLPVLAGYRDTDIPETADYFLRLPNDAAPLAPHRERIAAWLASWQGRRVPRAAIAHLDYEVKEKQRLEFLARFV